MKKAIIVDDELLAIEEIKYLLSFHDGINIVETFTSSIKAETFLGKNKIDIVFLDIQMPIKSGLELAKEICRLQQPPRIIFVTAFNSYAVEAFEVNAIDYILKPMNKDRFDKAINKILLTETTATEKSINNVFDKIQTNKDIITLYKEGFFLPIKFSDIIYCKSTEGYVLVHTINSIFIYNDTLSNLEKILNKTCFFRCHRSYLINIDFIEKIELNERTYIVKMKNKEQLIHISRANSQNFKKIMSIY